MWWKSLLVALLVLPPLAYVVGTLHGGTDAPERRPALVLDDVPAAPAPAERRVTLERREPPRTPARGGDDASPDDDRGDDWEDMDDGDDSDDQVTIVRPVPQDAGAGDDDGGGAGDDRDDRDDRDDGDDDDDGDDRGDD